MHAITNAALPLDVWSYFDLPLSTSPLPGLRSEIIVVSGIALLSFLATIGLLIFLAFLLIKTRKSRQPLYKNQYLLLVLNLVLADLLTATGSLIGFFWVHQDHIVAPGAACDFQAWMGHVGIVGSGTFVFAITMHTFYLVVLGRTISLRMLCGWITGLWVFTLVLTGIEAILHPKDAWTNNGMWCDTNPKFTILEIYTMFIWVFLVQAAVLIVYGTIFIIMRKRMRALKSQMTISLGSNGSRTNSNPSLNNISQMSRIQKTMVLYPMTYLITTLPLAVVCLYVLVNGPVVPLEIVCMAGVLVASAGWMNCILYSLNRRVFRTAKTNSPS